MATATIDASAMRNVGPSSANVWRHLLWKDFRQVWQLIVGVAVTQAFLQLLFGVMEKTIRVDMQNLSLNAINIALASPTLLAIACSGVLIGQERQTGCWTWSSSLPVSWRQSLLSKFIIWLGSSVVTTVVLLFVAAIALSMNQLSLSHQLFTEQADYGSWTYLMTIVIGVQVFIYLSIAALLIKDTLMAIVVAACGLFAFHFAVAVLNLMDVTKSLYGEGTGLSHDSTILLAYLGSYIVGSIWLALAYRWRWGSGQYASVSIFAGSATGAASGSTTGYARPQRAAWKSFAGSARQPSEFWMLLQHGIRSSLGLRVTVVCGALLMIAVSSGSELSFIAPCIAWCVLGVSVFSGEQTLSRYRFFADRGVSWKKFLVSHVAPPALLAGFVAIVATIEIANGGMQKLFWLPLVFWVPIFVVGMFSSIVFVSPIVSITVSFVVLVGAMIFSGSGLTLWESVASGYPNAVIIWIPISLLILVVMAIRMVPRWLTRDRLNATGIYFGTVLVAGLMPLVMGLSFGYLLIPNVPWQGTPLYQIKGVDWTDGPELHESRITYERSSLMQHWDLQAGLNSTNLSAAIKAEFNWEADPAWFDLRMPLIEAIEKGGAKPADPMAHRALISMTESSAIVALLATENRQKELAIRAWKANRKLIAFCQQPALLGATMQSISYVWEIWNTLDDDDLQFLVDTGELQNLTPVPRPTREQLNEVIRARATIRRIAMMGSTRDREALHSYSTYISSVYSLPLHQYPPIRWAYERQEALALNEDLGQSVRETPRTARFRDAIFGQYAVVSFLESRFAERLEKVKKP